MWQWIAKHLGVPLIMELISKLPHFFEFIKRKLEERKKKKEAEEDLNKSVEVLENAKTKDEVKDAFSKLS